MNKLEKLREIEGKITELQKEKESILKYVLAPIKINGVPYTRKKLTNLNPYYTVRRVGKSYVRSPLLILVEEIKT